MLLHSLKGAPCSIVLALLMIREPLQATQLATITGYSKPSIISGLRTTDALELTAPLPGRYAGWALRNHIRQLILGETPPEEEETPSEAPREVKSFYLGSSSCFSTSTSPPENPSIQEQLPLPREVKNFYLPDHHEPEPLPEAAAQAVELLTQEGCRTWRAQEAVTAALDKGWDAPTVLEETQRLFAYANSEQGQSIKAPPYYVAACLEAHEPAPPWVKLDGEDDQDDGRRYIEGDFAPWIQH